MIPELFLPALFPFPETPDSTVAPMTELFTPTNILIAVVAGVLTFIFKKPAVPAPVPPGPVVPAPVPNPLAPILPPDLLPLLEYLKMLLAQRKAAEAKATIQGLLEAPVPIKL